MSFAKYAQFYKDNGFFAGSKIKATVTDSTFIGQELILSKDNEVIRSMTIPTSGKVEFFTDESGTLTLSADNGTSTISGTVEISAYATYEVTLNGSASDTTREVYADKENVVFDDDKTSDTVNISYTGDVSNLTVKSSNTNIATATLNGNKVVVSDAGKGFKGTSDITVTVAKTNKFDAKDITIIATKENGTIDKSWTGLKNIVENELEEELCEVGEEFIVELSNGDTLTYIIGAINNDYPHQLIFIPKTSSIMRRYDTQRDVLWRDSELREWCNSGFYNSLPSELQEVISERYIEVANNDTELIGVNDKIWLPREFEVRGAIGQSYGREQYAYNIHWFDCFKNRLIECGSSSENSARTSSKYSGTNRGAVCIYMSGTSYYGTDASNITPRKVFPCFHIIKET